VVGASFVLADTANAVIAASFVEPTELAPEARSGTAVPDSRGLNYFLGPIASRNIFLHGEPIPGEDVVAEPAAGKIEEACTLPLQVLSTVFVPGSPHLSMAALLDVVAKRIVVVQVGERVLEVATLDEVAEPYDEEALRKDSVAIFRRDDGSRTVCRSDDAPTAPAPKGGAVPAVASGAGVRKIADNQFEISQGEIDAVMNGGLATIATTVRVVPYFESGKSAGFKLYSIKAGSLLSKLGLVNGDVLRKVNGYEISSPEKALEVYGMLKSERNVTLDVSRGGKPQTLQYAIR